MQTIQIFPQLAPTPFIAHIGAFSTWELSTSAIANIDPGSYEGESVTSDYKFDTDLRPIVDLHEDGYIVLQPIPIIIERVDDSFLATFEEANIAIGGVNRQDAYQSLVAEILDTFDALTEEGHLGPDAAAQLQVLRTYIGKA